MDVISTWSQERLVIETTKKTVSYRFFCLCLTFAGFWMFALGVYVGRDTCPIRFDSEPIMKQLAEWIESDIEKQHAYVQSVNSQEKKPEIQFFQALKTSDIDMMSQSENVDVSAKRVHLKSKQPIPDAELLTKRSTKKKTLAQFCSSSETVLDSSDCVTLQAAALKNASAAVEMVKQLKNMGFPAYTATINIPEKGLWHRVRVGAFETIQKARQMKSKLQMKNIDAIIVPFTRKDDFNIANAKDRLVHPES
ncbi:MAG: SPOR domain-containing protein [Candidatus Magnetomorum sp.]|nr:SPOR domain-containing protein [Candidatus Magnetomorum sp.]